MHGEIEREKSTGYGIFSTCRPQDLREAYEKMKLGDHSVIYEHGSIGEKNEYFGISNQPPHFFEKAVDNGWLKWIFCGHDHLNTLSLTYKGHPHDLRNVH